MGQVLSRGDSRPATAEELQAIATMREALSQLPVPTLQHRDNPHEYLFFAFSDGSGQDVNNHKLGPPTNVGILATQAKKLRDDPSNRIGYGYAKGIGAQSNGFARAVDGSIAATWDSGIKKMYREFASKAQNGCAMILRLKSASQASATAVAQCRTSGSIAWWTNTASWTRIT